MKRSILLLIISLLFFSELLATHQRAAEIIYTHVSGLTYKVKIITYTNNNQANDSRDYLPLVWGDGEMEEIPRVIKQLIGSNMVYNEYHATHTYPTIGAYMLSMEDPNRNYGVANIPNSIDVPIYVETELIINPFVGGNNSVQLLNEPLDFGCVNRVFVHNPGAYDVDGDSLSYKLVKCRGANGDVIPGYKYPNQVLPDPQNTFTINPYSGDVIWEVPNLQGEFNIAILIEEWRQGIKVGSVVRDMQIQIITCEENPPIIECLDDTCVTAGDELIFDIRAVSEDSDIVTITTTGGPFEVSDSPAYIQPDPAIGDSLAVTTFHWETVCNHVKKHPYSVYVKAVDDGVPVSLVSYKTLNITIVAPEVENVFAEPLGNSITLNWDPAQCQNAKGYKIYRRNGFSGFEPGYCETGVPAYTGYQLIDEIEGVDVTSYSDDNHGSGLVHGVLYCYIVTSYFSDGAESYASEEACTSLIRDLPVITNVSNDADNNLDGNIYLAWSKPVDLDTIEYPGPYQYEIYRAENLTGGTFNHISTNFGFNDTLYYDHNVNINQSGFPYRYRVDLISESVGYIGPSAEASSVFLSIYETDEELKLRFEFNVPWLNSGFVVFRKDPGGTTYDSIGVTNKKYYNDTGLENGLEYCYYVKAIGSYSTPGLIDPLINYSQKACGIPYDNVPPCPPVLTVKTDCEEVANYLSWTNLLADTCNLDIRKYLISYASTPYSEFNIIDSTIGIHDTTYIHSGLPSVIGCYEVRAVDSLGNISLPSNMACVDTLCGGFRLPNAFTPNGDQWNEYFKAYPGTMGAVEKIDLIIFNRYGKKVYTTNDKFFEWDGTNMHTGAALPEGAYFYVCDVYEYTFEGVRKRTIKGSITLLK